MTTEDPPKELATGIQELERELMISGVIPSPEKLAEVAKGLGDVLREGRQAGDPVRVHVPPGLRPALLVFAEACEAKLKKNDHKTGWRELPIEALSRLMQIEIEEFKVAMEFFTVADARNELVDIANFAMILSDRLSIEDQAAKVTK